MLTDVPAMLSGASEENDCSVTPVVRFVPKMLMSSPRATLPVEGESGAAFPTDET